MSAHEHDGPTTSGELVVLNGPRKGTRLRLAVPVTVVGAAEFCDVRVAGPGVADTHLVVTVTPAGPAVRSWHPDHTRVNGVETTARLLKHGDELAVGPCAFRLEWHVEELAPLTVAADEAELVLAPAEQEAAVEAALDERHHRLVGLMRELAGHRERARKLTGEDRQAVRRMKKQTERLHRAARADRMKAKDELRRLTAEAEAKVAAERQAVDADRAAAAAERQALAEEFARLEADRARFQADADAYQQRLHDAWELLTDGQRRLDADRRQMDDTLSRREKAVERRTAELAAQTAAADAGRARVEDRVKSLIDEVARLEQRAAAARGVVQTLEDRRAGLEGELRPALAAGPQVIHVSTDYRDRVPLDGKADRGVSELMADLADRDRELTREKSALAMTRDELERRAAELIDQRSVLAEHVASVAAARAIWQTAECRTVDELEQLIRAVAVKENDLAGREEELSLREAASRRRQGELNQLRGQLERWQAALTGHEEAAAAARDRATAELAVRGEHLAKREAAISALCRKWATARKRDVVRLRAELDRWAADRTRLKVATAELDDTRRQLAADVAKLAEYGLAVEEATNEVNARGPHGERHLRVARRKWEGHFTKFLAAIDERRTAIAGETSAADDRYRELVRYAAEWQERQATLAAEEQAAEAARLARSRELDERAAAVAAAEGRVKAAEQEVAEVRAGLDRMAAALLPSDAPPLPTTAPLIPLTAAEEPDDGDAPVLLKLPPRATEMDEGSYAGDVDALRHIFKAA